MGLSSELISQFVQATKTEAPKKTETTVFGTIVEHDGKQYMRIDGSDLLTPLTTSIENDDHTLATTTSIKNNDRVVAIIKNHTLIVTGNITYPSASKADLDNVADEITTFEIAIGYRVTAEDINATNAIIENLRAKIGKYTELEAVNGTLDYLFARIAETDYLYSHNIEAINADIDRLKANLASFEGISTDDLEAMNADIGSLRSYVGNFTYLSTEVLDATKAEVKEMVADKLSSEQANLQYANIDFSNIGKAAMEWFYAQSGLIDNVVVGDGTITGNLVGVTISGDLIEGNTIKADKLVIKGSDGLYYKLNTDGVTTEAEQTDDNSINGQVIKAKSITATKIAVNDLVAFDATIGGFTITDTAIYSEVKDSEGNMTRGLYMDSDGQVNVGDDTNFIRYIRDENGDYKLTISASSILYALGDRQYSLEDLGQLGNYIHVGTYEGEPCIELGESDSDFKLLITNTRIMFREGTGTPAYFTNQSMHIKKAVVEEELQQGGFVWKVRANGNLGLVWKGVTS
jgi:hypothetical protein